jgi:hypothetical protein
MDNIADYKWLTANVIPVIVEQVTTEFMNKIKEKGIVQVAKDVGVGPKVVASLATNRLTFGRTTIRRFLHAYPDIEKRIKDVIIKDDGDNNGPYTRHWMIDGMCVEGERLIIKEDGSLWVMKRVSRALRYQMEPNYVLLDGQWQNISPIR